MARSYSARDTIQLPVLDAHSTHALALRLLAQYRRHARRLARTKVKARAAALERVLATLTAALTKELAATTSAQAATKLDPVVDATWAGLVIFLEAWARLRWRDEGVAAQAVLDTVFPDRLEFTQHKYPQQWSEANTRLLKLYEARKDERDTALPTHAETIVELGGQEFLDEIRAKHTDFAAALGLRQGTAAPVPVDVRTPYEATLDAVRDVIAAVAQLDADDLPDHEKVRHELLFVIDEFEPEARKRAPGTTDGNPAPAPGPGPTSTG